jgi:acyl dehydratase
MSLDYSMLENLPPRETQQRFDARDTILYALCVGANGAARSDDLKFTYERDLEALPTMATVLAPTGPWLREPRFGADWRRILHAEQSLVSHRNLAAVGSITSVLTVDRIDDKGADVGALLHLNRQLYDTGSGDLLATDRHTWMLRGDGARGGTTTPAPRAQPIPSDVQPDEVVHLSSRTDQALMFRLLGDWNPLHAEPAAAVAAGFARPILHGLCTYGMVGRALLSRYCENDPRRMRQLDVRFTGPLYPGETLRLDLWQRGPGEVQFRALCAERSTPVMDFGHFKHGSLGAEVREPTGGYGFR